MFSIAVDYENSNQEENEQNNVFTQSIPCVLQNSGNSTGRRTPAQIGSGIVSTNTITK